MRANFGDFGIINPKIEFWILANLGLPLNLVSPNLDRCRRQLSNDTKIIKFGQNSVHKIENSYISRKFCGSKGTSARPIVLKTIAWRKWICASPAPARAGFKNFLQNFGDESQFWWILEILISTSKFWKKFVTRVRPYWDKFWKILTIEFWWNRKVMINHRGGILIFGQILSKSKILDFRVKDFKFVISSNFGLSPILSISVKFSSNL